MNQTDIANVASQAAQKSKNILAQQVDRQASAVGTTLTQTATDLKQVGANLRQSGTIGGAADVADWAADYVSRAADYLSAGNTDRFIVDVEAFARRRPWAVAASAAALGFIAARVVKSSSARRYADTSYNPDYGSAIVNTTPYGSAATDVTTKVGRAAQPGNGALAPDIA